MPSIVVTPKYNPFTFDELYRPLAETTKMQMALEDQYNAMEMEAAKWERLADSNVDQDSYLKYKNYAQALRESANELATNGLNPQSRQVLYGLRTRFNEDIFPMQEAYNWRQKQAEIQQKAMMEDPSYIWERQAQDIPLSEIISNPSMTLNGVSGEKIRKSYGEAVKNLKTSWAGNPLIQKLEDKYPNLMPEIGGFLQEIETTGVTRNDLDAFINDFASNYKEEDREGINLAIRSLLNAIEPIRDLYNIDKFNGNETIENAFEGAIKLGAYDSLGANKDSIFKGNDPNAGKKSGSGTTISVTKPYPHGTSMTFNFGDDEEVEKYNDMIEGLNDDFGKENINVDNGGTATITINPRKMNEPKDRKGIVSKLRDNEITSSTRDLLKETINGDYGKSLGLETNLSNDNLNTKREHSREEQVHIHDDIIVPMHNDIKKLIKEGKLTMDDINNFLSGIFFTGEIYANPEKMKVSDAMKDNPGWLFNSYDNTVYSVDNDKFEGIRKDDVHNGTITDVAKTDNGNYRVGYTFKRPASGNVYGYVNLTEDELISVMLYGDSDEKIISDAFASATDYLATKIAGTRDNQVEDFVDHYLGLICQGTGTNSDLQKAVNDRLGSTDLSNRAKIDFTLNRIASGSEGHFEQALSAYTSTGGVIKKLSHIDKDSFNYVGGDDFEDSEDWTPTGYYGSMYSPDMIVSYRNKKGNFNSKEDNTKVIVPYDIDKTYTMQAWADRIETNFYAYILSDNGKLSKEHKKEMKRVVNNLKKYKGDISATFINQLEKGIDKTFSKKEMEEIAGDLGRLSQSRTNTSINEGQIFGVSSLPNYSIPNEQVFNIYAGEELKETEE